MKCWFALVLCIGTTFAASIDIYPVGGVGSSHYEQHSQSVDAGRRGVAHRLGSSSSPSSANYVDCGACLQQQQQVAFDAETLDSGLGQGVGVVGLSGGGSSSLSSSALTSSSTQQLQPLYISPSSSGSSSSLSSSHQVSNSQSSPIIIPVGGGSGSNSENYQRHYEKHVQSNAAPIVVSPGGGGETESYQRHYEKRIQSNAAPIVLAPNVNSGVDRYQQHYEKHVQSNAAPVLFTPNVGGVENYQRYEKRIQSNSAPIQLAPIHLSPNSESFHQQSQRIVKSNAVAPVYVQPSGGLESYHQQSQRIVKTNAASPLIVTPVVNSGSEFSSQYSQNLLQNQQALPIAVYSPSGSSIHSHDALTASSSLSGGSLIPLNTGGSSSSLLESSNSHLSSGSVLGGHYPTLGSVHGTTGHLSSGIGSSSSDLNYYMSESERLAKLQAQSVNSGGVRSGSSVIDTGLSSGNSLGGLGGGSGNYRSQAWEKSSKWASGTEFGHDGRPKNYNHLTTAEAEQHNVNGKHAGYKAATTTLDDDGKVSTYSIHTP